jgi:hypothetical protein
VTFTNPAKIHYSGYCRYRSFLPYVEQLRGQSGVTVETCSSNLPMPCAPTLTTCTQYLLTLLLTLLATSTKTVNNINQRRSFLLCFSSVQCCTATIHRKWGCSSNLVGRRMMIQVRKCFAGSAVDCENAFRGLLSHTGLMPDDLLFGVRKINTFSSMQGTCSNIFYMTL